MDTWRGPFGEPAGGDAWDAVEDEIGHEAPPQPVGQDERRMQVRAYNHWASLLGNRTFPLLADLEAGPLPDFEPNSVLLDFSEGIANPVLRRLGSAIAAESECDCSMARTLADVPGRSLLSRITDHYMQIIANQAPIGFEAEFVNQRGRTILYRGILLPFSEARDSDTIDLIYGVINWKELADQQTTDALMEEIDRALQPRSARDRMAAKEPLTAWADGPLDLSASSDGVLDLATLDDGQDGAFGWGAFDLGALASGEEGLADLLASARELAEAAHGSEERSRKALYAAIGRAFDFALAAQQAPEDFAELVADAGLAVQERAPLIPLVKLVFGAGYDKTRLTEYATVIGHGQRLGLAAGSFAAFLASAPGGLKGVVQTERRLRREDKGADGPAAAPGRALADRLRQLPARSLAEIPASGEEFTVLIARRTDDGAILLVGEVAADPVLLERAARHLLG